MRGIASIYTKLMDLPCNLSRDSFGEFTWCRNDNVTKANRALNNGFPGFERPRVGEKRKSRRRTDRGVEGATGTEYPRAIIGRARD